MAKKRINVFGTILSIFLLFLIAYTAVAFVSQSIQIKKYKEKIANIENQIAIEEKEMKKLQEDKKNYKKDYYVEKIAREKLKMVKLGELVYIDVDKKGDN